MIGYGFSFSFSFSENEANDLYEKNLNENHWGYNLNIILINATEYSTDIVTY